MQAPLEEVPAGGEVAPTEGAPAVAGSEPPEVRVLVNGLQKDAAMPEAEAEKPEPINLHAEPVRSFLELFWEYFLFRGRAAPVCRTTSRSALVTRL